MKKTWSFPLRKLPKIGNLKVIKTASFYYLALYIFECATVKNFHSGSLPMLGNSLVLMRIAGFGYYNVFPDPTQLFY